MNQDRTRLVSSGNELYEIDLNCLERQRKGTGTEARAKETPRFAAQKNGQTGEKKR